MSSSEIGSEKPTTMFDIERQIRESVDVDNHSVVNLVIMQEKTAEIMRRADIVAGALKTAKDVRKELKKIKEDVVTFVEGREVKAFSQDMYKKKTDMEKKLSDIDLALNEAIQAGDYQKLEKFSK